MGHLIPGKEVMDFTQAGKQAQRFMIQSPPFFLKDNSSQKVTQQESIVKKFEQGCQDQVAGKDAFSATTSTRRVSMGPPTHRQTFLKMDHRAGTIKCVDMNEDHAK